MPLRIDPLVDPGELRVAEEATGLSVPTDFAEVCTNWSGRVAFGWDFGWGPGSSDGIPGPIVGGSVQNMNPDTGVWNARQLARFRQDVIWIGEARFGEVSDSPWAQMLPIASVGTGDYVALAPDGSVYMLGHEIGDTIRLASSFTTFMTEWSALGCPVVYHLDQFMDPATGELSSSTERSREWIAWMNS